MSTLMLMGMKAMVFPCYIWGVKSYYLLMNRMMKEY